MLAPIKLMSAAGGTSGSVTFGSAGTFYWVAPAGVTSVTITGQGGSKSAAYYTWSTVSNLRAQIANGTGFTNNVGATLSYSRIRSDEQTRISALNAITTSPDGQSATIPRSDNYYWNYSASPDYWAWSRSNNTGTYRRVGTFTANSTLAGLSGNVPTSEDTPVSNANYDLGGGSLQVRSTNYDYGTDSTGLGYTFPDDSSSAQYADVAVTPLQSYPIVVGVDEGGDTAFVTIEWG